MGGIRRTEAAVEAGEIEFVAEGRYVLSSFRGHDPHGIQKGATDVDEIVKEAPMGFLGNCGLLLNVVKSPTAPEVSKRAQDEKFKWSANAPGSISSPDARKPAMLPGKSDELEKLVIGQTKSTTKFFMLLFTCRRMKNVELVPGGVSEINAFFGTPRSFCCRGLVTTYLKESASERATRRRRNKGVQLFIVQGSIFV